MSAEIIRALVSDADLLKCRDQFIELMVSHVPKDLTLMEVVLMKDLLDIGIKTVKEIWISDKEVSE